MDGREQARRAEPQRIDRGALRVAGVAVLTGPLATIGEQLCAGLASTR